MRLDIELKGPEPEVAVKCAARVQASRLRSSFPRSEDWMNLDVVAYAARNRARQAQAQVVHLHPTQLTADVVAEVRAGAVEIHAWQVKDPQALQLAADLELSSICTDQVEQAVAFRAQYTRAAS